MLVQCCFPFCFVDHIAFFSPWRRNLRSLDNFASSHQQKYQQQTRYPKLLTIYVFSSVGRCITQNFSSKLFEHRNPSGKKNHFCINTALDGRNVVVFPFGRSKSRIFASVLFHQITGFLTHRMFIYRFIWKKKKITYLNVKCYRIFLHFYTARNWSNNVNNKSTTNS